MKKMTGMKNMFLKNNINIHTENACSCPTCQKMCKTCPCLGTPEDILNIIIAGHGDKLAFTLWGTGLISGEHDSIVEMIQPRMDKNGCAFLDDKNLCTLHDLGLKPTEGKLANHADKIVISFKDTISYKVAMTWIDENGVNNAEKQLVNAVLKLQNKQ